MIARQIYFYIVSLFKSKWHLEYDRAFIYQSVFVLPFVHWLHQQGKQGTTMLSKNTNVLDYSSDNNQERFTTWRWSAQTLKERYKTQWFIIQKPIHIVCNELYFKWGNPRC